MKKRLIACLLTAALLFTGCGSGDGRKAGKEKMKMSDLTVTEECPKEAYRIREDVEYGTIEHQYYQSETTGGARGVNVLLPAGYTTEKQYPVIYFQHGIFGDEYSMIKDPESHLKELTANLVADGLAEEMILVFPNMYASDDSSLTPGFDQASVKPYDNFINDLVNDLMPFIKENYSVKSGRDNTGIIGFSMGGRESLYIGFQRPDLFGYVGAISPAPGLTPAKDWAMEHPGQMAEEDLHFDESSDTPYVLMICCGTQDGTVGKFPKSYHDILDRNGVEHIWYEVPGADHNGQAVRSGFYNFARFAFH